MKRFFKVLVARAKADWYCIRYFPKYCLMVRSLKPAGCIMYRTVKVEVGSGSVLKGTWKTEKVFYEEDV